MQYVIKKLANSAAGVAWEQIDQIGLNHEAITKQIEGNKEYNYYVYQFTEHGQDNTDRACYSRYTDISNFRPCLIQ